MRRRVSDCDRWKMSTRIEGIIDRLSNTESFEDIKWILGDSIIANYAVSIIDDHLKANVDFQSKAGLTVTVERIATGRKPCKYCEKREGKFTAPNIPASVWERHSGCYCYINYSGDGIRQTLSGDGKRWEVQSEEDLEARRNFAIAALQDPDAEAVDLLKQIYDYKVENGGFSLSAVGDMEDAGIVDKVLYADYGNLSPAEQKAWTAAIGRMNDEFESTLQSIGPMSKQESFLAKRTLAKTSTDPNLARSGITYNRNQPGLDKLKRMATTGYCPDIDTDKLLQYIPTHELGHSVFTPSAWRGRRKTLVGGDLSRYRKAAKEIDDIYKAYAGRVGELEQKIREYSGKFIDGTITQDELAESQRLSRELAKTRISKYSLTNADEMVAEAYAEHTLGRKRTETTDKVIDVLRRYFGKGK